MEGVSILPGTVSAEANWADQWFKKLPTDIRFGKVTYSEFHPISSIDGQTDIQFVCRKWNVANYYLLDKALLNIKCHVEGEAPGSVVPENSKCAWGSNILHLAFQEVKMMINDKDVFPHTSRHHYKGYFHNLLNFSGEVKRAQLESQGWDEDDVGEYDRLDTSNTGFVGRMDLISTVAAGKRTYNKNEHSFIGPFLFDFFEGQQLLNGCELKFDLRRNIDKVIMMANRAAGNVRFVLDKVSLFIPSAELNTDVFLRVESLLKKNPFEIYFRRTEISTIQIPANTSEHPSENLWLGPALPSRIFIGFVRKNALSGDYARNPYNFIRTINKGTNEYIKEVSMTINGYPVDGLPSSEINDFFRLHETLQMNDSPFTSSISRKLFNGGAAIYAYDLSTSKNASASLIVPAVREGILRLNVVFSKESTEAITAILLSECPSLISIDSMRKPKLNYF